MTLENALHVTPACLAAVEKFLAETFSTPVSKVWFGQEIIMVEREGALDSILNFKVERHAG
jgi:hypothetical protein